MEALVNEARLWQRLEELAEIGSTPSGGMDRQAFTSADSAARCRVIDWARRLGAEPELDPIGNLFLRYAGSEPALPAILTGSHLDTQPNGGRFDGVFGVVAGLEVLEAIHSSGARPERAVELVVWANEEGSRFSPTTMGSGVRAGAVSLEHVLDSEDREGVTVKEALGAHRDALGSFGDRTFDTVYHAYVEAHIEQGPVLEQAGSVIGAVTGIQGLRQFEIGVHGRAAHAGTTPEPMRRDAVRSAAELIVKIHAGLAGLGEEMRATVGRMQVVPNSPNTIAENVTFTVDLRHPDEAALDRAEAMVRALAAAGSRCEVEVRELIRSPGIEFADEITEAVVEASSTLGYAHSRLPSGATHDARYMVGSCASGMVFVPCRGGVSHSQDEFAEPSHLAAGARVLCRVIGELAGIPTPSAEPMEVTEA